MLGDTHSATLLLCSRIAFGSIRRDCQNSRQTARASGCLCAGTCNTTVGAYRSTWTCTKSTRLWRGESTLIRKIQQYNVLYICIYMIRYVLYWILYVLYYILYVYIYAYIYIHTYINQICDMCVPISLSPRHFCCTPLKDSSNVAARRPVLSCHASCPGQNAWMRRRLGSFLVSERVLQRGNTVKGNVYPWKDNIMKHQWKHVSNHEKILKRSLKKIMKTLKFEAWPSNCSKSLPSASDWDT